MAKRGYPWSSDDLFEVSFVDFSVAGCTQGDFPGGIKKASLRCGALRLLSHSLAVLVEACNKTWPVIQSEDSLF